jgi:quinol monooxygenase YgiN
MDVTVLVEWQVKPDEISTAKTLLLETFASTLNFEGCKRYEVYENQNSPGNIILLTEWNSQDRYDRYLEWRKKTGVLDRFAQTFANPPIIRYFESIVSTNNM